MKKIWGTDGAFSSSSRVILYGAAPSGAIALPPLTHTHTSTFPFDRRKYGAFSCAGCENNCVSATANRSGFRFSLRFR